MQTSPQLYILSRNPEKYFLDSPLTQLSPLGPVDRSGFIPIPINSFSMAHVLRPHRALLEDLYLTKDLTLQDVMKHMKDHYSVTAGYVDES